MRAYPHDSFHYVLMSERPFLFELIDSSLIIYPNFRDTQRVRTLEVWTLQISAQHNLRICEKRGQKILRICEKRPSKKLRICEKKVALSINAKNSHENSGPQKSLIIACFLADK